MRRNKWPSLMASLLALAIVSSKGAAAQNGPLSTSEATALLARIYAIDLKCQVLSASDSDDLYQLLLSAQVLLAKKTSLKEAQTALADGKTAAEACTCGDDDKALVVSTFALARVAGSPVVENSHTPQSGNAKEPVAARPEATVAPEEPVAQLVPPRKAKPKGPVTRPVPPQKVKLVPEAPVTKPVPQPKIKSAPKAPVTRPVPEPKIKSAPKALDTKPVPRPQIKPAQLSKIVQKKNADVAKAAAPQKTKSDPFLEEAQDYTGLLQYGGLAQRYYIELKCRSMSYEEMKRLYATIVVRHRAAISSYPRFEVKAMLRAAKARADIANCS